MDANERLRWYAAQQQGLDSSNADMRGQQNAAPLDFTTLYSADMGRTAFPTLAEQVKAANRERDWPRIVALCCLGLVAATVGVLMAYARIRAGRL